MAFRLGLVMPPLLPMPPVRGGAVETLVGSLLRNNERDAQLEIVVFCRYDEIAAERAKEYQKTKFRMVRVWDPGLKAYDLLTRAVRKLLGLRLPPQAPYLHRVLRQLKDGDWDAVVVENVAEYALPVKRVCGADTYLHLHNRYIRPELPWSEGIVAAGMRFIAISEFIRQDVLAVEGARRSCVRVLPNCIAVERFDRARLLAFRRTFRAEYGMAEDAVVFLYTGRLLPEKGVLELLEAFLRLKDRRAYLLVVGSNWYSSNASDPYVARLRTLSKDSDRVAFTGYVAYADMPGMYAAADVACVPSLWEEPAGLTVLESMAAGLPLITTGSGGIQEYLTEGCALLVERGDGLIRQLERAMRALLDDAELRARMGDKGYRAAQQYNEGQYYRSFCSLLRDFGGGEGR